MKTFRKALFYTLYSITAFSFIRTTMETPFGPPVAPIILVSAIMGMQLWAVVFLKTEPNLARIGLICGISCVLAFLVLAWFN
jgi:hypothetical protein